MDGEDKKRDDRRAAVARPRRRPRRRIGWRPRLFLLPFTFCLLTFCAHAQSGWTRQNSGTFAWLHAVYFVDDNRGWAVGGKGTLLGTEDGGATWRLKRSPTDDALRDIFFTDARTGWIVCERSIYKLKTKDEARSYLLKTSDGGVSWARVEAAGADVNARLVRVRFADAEHGWAFGEEGALYATSDGGASWARQRVPTRRLLLGGTFGDDALAGWLVGAGATFLYTADGGANWRAGNVVADSVNDAGGAPASKLLPASAPTPSPRVNAVSFVDERRGWAVGAGGFVFKTVNGGRSWRAVESGTDADLLDVNFFNEVYGWAVGAGGALMHTRDGGETWRAWPAMTTHQLERVFFTDPSRGWAVGFGGTILSYTDAKSAPPKSPQPHGPPRLRRRDDKPTP